MYKSVKPYIDAVLDFLYPAFCTICTIRLESGNGLVCENCWQALPRLKSDGQPEIPNVSQLLAVWEFGEELQQIVHEFKFFGKRSLGKRMGDEMAKLASSRPNFSSADLIVPVPLHKTRMRERGYNQSLLLAQRIARELRIPCAPTILKRERYTQTQSTLNIEQRTRNVQGAFVITDPERIRNKIVILVDDVVTTGATLTVCAECLRTAGAAKVLVITAAKTP